MKPLTTTRQYFNRNIANFYHIFPFKNDNICKKTRTRAGFYTTTLLLK